MKTFGASIAIILGAVSPALAQNSGTWQESASMLYARGSHSATRLPNGHVFVSGGWGGAGYVLPCEKFDPLTATWTARALLPFGSEGHFATVLPDGRILIAGGSPAPQSTAFFVYSPVTDTWSSGTLPFQPVWGIRESGTTLANGHPVILNQGALYDFNPASGQWTQKASMPVSTQAVVTLLRDGRMLAATNFVRAFVYSPAGNLWSEVDFRSDWAQDERAVLLKNGHVLVAGGALATSSQEWDPVANHWIYRAVVPADRYAHDMVQLTDGTALLVGGLKWWDTNEAPFAFSYDPDSAAWTARPHDVSSRGAMGTVRLNSGQVLACGGRLSGTSASFCDIYTPDNSPSFSEPVAEVVPSALNVSAGVPVSFGSGASMDPDGGTLVYHWEFSDGSDANTASTTHAFQTPGTYDVGLLVTDDEGNMSNAVVTVTITAAPTTYAQWRSLHFDSTEAGNVAVSGEAADPDGDGIPNLQEYAFAMDPRMNSQFGLPKYEIEDWRLTFSFNQYMAATDLVFDVFFATSVTGPWSSGPVVLEEVSRVATGPVSRIKVRTLQDIRLTPAGFIKLRILHTYTVFGFWPPEAGQESSTPEPAPESPTGIPHHGRCGSIGVDLMLFPLAAWALRRFRRR